MKILESFQGPLMQNVLMETYEQVSFEPGVDHFYETRKYVQVYSCCALYGFRVYCKIVSLLLILMTT